MKQYVALIRDHSGSMQLLTKSAAKDYNSNIQSIKEAAAKYSIDTIATVILCGIGPGRGQVRREIVNSNINVLTPIVDYPANGSSTPLFDAVGSAIELFKTMPDYNDPNVSFLIQTITDGQDNDSVNWAKRISETIRELQASDKWTFVFRVPRGYRGYLTSIGIHEGNVLEWDQTDAGLQSSTVATTAAYNDFYEARSKGVTATRHFFQPSAVNINAINAAIALDDISTKVSVYPVNREEQIADFVKRVTGQNLEIGTAFYQLTKYEKDVQDYKKVCIRNKKTGKVFTGQNVRDLLGLPSYGNISLSPGAHGEWDIFIQSTSRNRKLKTGTNLLVLKA